jgi:outer membrane protein OmpA-like peptidoglycan-associated protein
MTINLLDILKQIFGGEFTTLASRFLGEPEGSTKSAVTSMLPALLSAMVQKSSTSAGASNLFSAINSSNVDANLPGNLSQIFTGGGNANNLVKAGSGMLGSLLGQKASPLAGALSSMSGISGSSATNLLSLAAPIILGALKKLIGEHGLNTNSLASMLGSQASAVEGALDPRLSQAMGIQLPNVGHAAAAVADTTSTGLGKALRWIIAALVALAALWLYRSCSTDTAQKAAVAAEDAATAAVQASSDGAKSAVATVRSIDLPDGTKLDVPEGGFIDSLVVFVSKPDWGSGKSFAFDALTFETDSATLTSSSTAQLTQLATVLKAFPSVYCSVEGHTDNTGDPAANKKLSEDRAAAVKDALVGMGVEPDHATSVGWGAEKPVASNDTEEGKLQNRRVEITLTKK